jgi:hypothetical protein
MFPMSLSIPLTRSPSRSTTRAVRRSAASLRNPPRVPMVSSSLVAPMDYHFSHYSLADADGGVCIDMTGGRVSFNWAYVPLGSVPGAFASFVRRLHFRNGRHVDEPMQQIQVPSQPRSLYRDC